MDINWFRGVMTVFWMLAFLGIVWWAYHPRTKSRFDDAEQLPFADELRSKKMNNEENRS